MPESRRAGRLSGGKGPPLASTKRGALPPILSQTRFITGNGQPYGCPFPVFRRDNDVIRWRAVCWRAVCGPLDAKESGRDWLRAKKIFRRRQAGRGLTPPSPVMFAPWRSGGMSCPSSEDGDPPYRPEEKFLGGAGEHEGERRPFFKKVSSPPHQNYTASGQRWRASYARRPWP